MKFTLLVASLLIAKTSFASITDGKEVDFSGAQVGIGVGYSSQTTRTWSDNFNKSESSSGLNANLKAGYLYKMSSIDDKLYFGYELGYDYFSNSATGSGYSSGDRAPLNAANHMFSVGAKLGYAVHDSVMIYALAAPGLSLNSYQSYAIGGSDTIYHETETQGKFALKTGLGLDLAVTENILVGAYGMYFYQPFGSETTLPGISISNEIKDQFALGMNVTYKF